MEGERKGGEWKEEGKGKVLDRKGNLPPLKFRSGYATGHLWGKRFTKKVSFEFRVKE